VPLAPRPKRRNHHHPITCPQPLRRWTHAPRTSQGYSCGALHRGRCLPDSPGARGAARHPRHQHRPASAHRRSRSHL